MKPTTFSPAFSALSKIAIVLMACLFMWTNTLNAQTSVIIGTGTIVNCNTCYPAPYGHYYNGAKHQFLIPASELASAGAYQGNILALAFDVAVVNGVNLTGFTIKLGLTTTSSLNAWEPGLTTVYSVAGYTETAGWNTHTFSTPFYWDGTSNLVVETCFDNYPNGFTNNAGVYQSSTSYNSSIWHESDGGGVCPYVGGYSSSMQRPNIQFSFAPITALDAGVYILDNPVNPVIPGNNNINVRFRNFGTDTLSTCSLGWSMNGTPQSMYSWTGTLLPSDTSASLNLGTYSFATGIYELKAYTTSPNGSTDGYTPNDTMTRTLYACNPLSGSYTIGGASPDFTSFSLAVNTLITCGVSGPVTFNVASGTYTEQIYIPMIQGASATNRIRFQSSSGDSSTVILGWPASSQGADNYTLMLFGTQYVQFKDMTIARTGTGDFARVVDIGGGSHNAYFSHCHFSGPSTTTNDWNYERALMYSGWMSTDTNLIVQNSHFANGSAAVAFMNNWKGVNLLLDGNIMLNQYFRALYISWMTNVLVTMNHIQTNSVSTDFYGIYLEDVNVHNCTGNKVINPASNGYGIYINYCDANSVNRSLTANNFVHINTTGYQTYGIYVNNSDYQDIGFNTVNITGSNSGSSVAAYLDYWCTDLRVKNNILVNQAGGSAMLINNDLNQLSSDYNDLYTTGATLVNVTGYPVPDLISWQTTGYDLFSVSMLPTFTSASDLHTSSLVLSSAGIPFAGVTTDIDGESRPSVPDIGADEFMISGTDAAITILTPVSPTTLGSKTVSVRITNTASTTITSLALAYTNGGTPVTQSFTGLSIAAQSYQDLTFTTPYNFSSAGPLAAFISLVNGSTDLYQGNDTAARYLCFTLAGTYTINPGLSTGGTNFNSFQDAIDAMYCGGISGNVVFNVSSGTYTEQLQFAEIPGASASSTVTFQSLSGDSSSVNITYAATGSGDNFVLSLYGADFLTFRNMTFTATGSSYGRVVVLENEANNNTFSNNAFYSSPVTTSSIDFAVIYSSSSNDTNNTFNNNLVRYGSCGVYWYGQGTYSPELSNRFIDNEFNGFYYYGSYIRYQRNMNMQGNLFMNSPSSSTVYGGYIYYLTGYNLIQQNRLIINGTGTNYGFYFGYSNGSQGDSLIVRNNFIALTQTASVTSYGIYSYYGSFAQYLNNSINVLSSYSGSRCLYMYYGNDHTVVNNILHNGGSGYSLYIYGTPVARMDYNDLYSYGTYLGYWNNTYMDIASWQTGTGYDAHSISVQPGFSSNSDLHISSLAMNSTGTSLAAVTDDIDGETRPSVPDIGADEFTVTGTDAKISLLSPASPTTPGAKTVIVRINNTASNTITSLNLAYTDGGTPVSQSFTGLSIAPGNFQDLSFSTNYNFSGYTGFRAYISAVNGSTDIFQGNDTTAWINLCSIMAGTYTINSAVATGGTNFNSFTDAVTAMLCGGVGAHVTFNVASGTYNEQVYIPPIAGAADTATITFQSASSDSSTVNILYAASSTTDNYVVKLDGADYIRFRNISMSSNGTSYARVLDVSNEAHNNIFSNNAFLGAAVTSSSNNLAVIYSNSSLDTNNVFSNNLILNGSAGIYWYGYSTSLPETNNQFVGNEISGFYYYGAYISYQNHMNFEANMIANSAQSSTVYGCYLYYLRGSNNLHANKFDLNSNSTTYGFYVYYSDGYSGEPLNIYNNFIALTKNSSISAYGIYTYYSNYIDIMFNSINLLSTYYSSRAAYIYYGSNINLNNNIIANLGTGYSLYIYGTGVNNCDYNDIYSLGSNIAYFNADFSTLAAWRAATAWDQHSVSLSPSFTSNADLHTSALGLNGAGIAMPAVTVDIDGETRLGSPDIGADEFVPVGLDAIISWVSPVSPISAGTQPVKVSIGNTMSTTITSVNLSYTDGNTVTTQNFTGLSLSSGAVDTLTFSTQYNFSGSGYFRARVNNVNGIADNYQGNDTTAWQALCVPLVGAYTIDSSQASGGTNFQTFNDAVNALICGGVLGDVVFNVAPGTFNEQISIPEIPSVTDTSTVTFRGSSADSTAALITYYANSSYDNYVVRLDGSDYITFEGIAIAATGYSYGHAIVVDNASEHNRFSRNHITSGMYSSSNLSCVYFSSNNTNPNNTFSRNNMYGGYYGIYINSYNYVSGIRIDSNVITDFYYTGLYSSNTYGIEVNGNIIEDRAGSSTTYGLSLYYADQSSTVSGNKILLQSTGTHYGIYYYYSDGYSYDRTLISNNFIVDINSSSSLYGIYLYNCSYVDVFHNTVNQVSGNSSSRAFYDYSGYQMQIANNVFVHQGDGYAYYCSYPSGIIMSDNNDLYSDGTYLAYWNGDIASLADLRLASARDTASVSVLPNFHSNTDLHTYDLYLNNIGMPLYMNVPYDIDGELRDSLNPDIGADEFSTPAIELKASAILSPSDGCGLGMEPVILRIINLGTDTVSSGLMAYYQSGNSSPVGESVTASIPSGDTLDYTFSTALNMTVLADSIFSLTAWVSHASDPINDNDTVTAEAFSGYIAPAPSASDVTVSGGSTATLIATSPYEILWYTDSMAPAWIHFGDTLVTPPLWDSTTFYAEARAGGAPAITEIGTGTGTISYVPAYGWYNYSWSAMIWDASEINSAGMIDTIAVYVGNSIGSYTMYNQRVYLAHTTMSDFSGNNSKPDPALMTQVYNATVVWTGPGWFRIVTDADFEYNGVDNLMIYWENRDGSYTGGYPTFRYTSTSSYRTMYNYSDAGFPTGNGSIITSRPNIRLSISSYGCPSNRIPVHANVTGSPAIVLDKPCANLGNVMQFLHAYDTVIVKNTGNYLLKLYNFQNSLPQYTIQHSQNQVIPGDSAVIYIDMVANTPGIYNDTIRIANNDVDTFICLSALVFGAPVDSLNPASFNVTLTQCQDTLELPLTVRNTGLSDLTYSISGAGLNMTPASCYPVTTGYCCNMGIYNVNFGDINNSSGNGAYGYQDFTSTQSTYLVPGQTYTLNVTTGTQYNEHVRAWIDYNNNGTFEVAEEIMYSYSGYVNHSTQVVIPPNIIVGVPLRMRIISDYSGNSMPSYCTNPSYGQCEDYSVQVKGGITIAAVTDTAAPGSFNNHMVSFTSTGLWNGTYISQISVSTNNPLHPLAMIPCTLTVNGAAMADFSEPCHDFDSVQQYGNQTDTIYLRNTGCDILSVSSYTNTLSEFVVSFAATSINPYDSAAVIMQFGPNGLGNYFDTLVVNTNIGVNRVCLSGTGVVIPVISTIPDTLIATISACNDSVAMPLTVYNTGAGELIYSFPYGYGVSFDSTNTVYYNTSGYTSYHTFNNIPPGADSLYLYVTIAGDFDYSSEYASLYIENMNMGILPDGDVSNGTYINLLYKYGGNQLLSWLADGSIQVNIANSSAVDAFGGEGNFHRVRVYLPGTGWLSTSIEGDTVTTGDSSMVNVMFNANGLYSGTYSSMLRIVSNDPIHPNVSIPTIMIVDGAPELRLSDSCLTIGNVVENSVKVDTFWIRNTGCDTLKVTNLTVPYPAFSLSTTNLLILPRDSQMVKVTFAPTITGSYNGLLNIYNNGGDTTLCLQAVCVDAAQADVSPDSTGLAMLCLTTDSIEVTVRNLGLGTLQYQVMGGYGFQGDSSILLIRNSWPFGFNMETYLESQFGVDVDVITSAQINTTNFYDYDLILTASDQAATYYNDITAAKNIIGSWVDNGGLMVYVLANFAVTQVQLPGGVIMTGGNNEYYNNVLQSSHPIATGLPSQIYGAYANYNHFTQLVPGTGLLTSTSNSGNPSTIEYAWGRGKILATGMPWELLHTQGYNSAPILGNAMSYALAQTGTAPAWISFNNSSGSVLSGDSLHSTVLADASLLIAGTHRTNIFIASNDPVTPWIRIPFDVTVTGYAQLDHNISTCIDFDSVIVGDFAVDSFKVWNDGCDTLRITSITPGLSSYSVVPGTANIATGDTSWFTVTFTPTSIGNLPTSILLNSNIGTSTVCATGYGDYPPIAQVNPDSFYVSILSCADSVSSTMLIRNTGTGILDFSIPGEYGSAYYGSHSTTYSYTGSNTFHSFGAIPAGVDSIYLTITLNGDFDDPGENASLIIEGTNLGVLDDMDLPLGTDVVIELAFGGPLVSTWLSDAQLDVTIDNNNNVNYYSSAANLHKVELSLHGVEWLEASPRIGTLPAGDSVVVQLEFNSTGIASGLHYHRMNVVSNDPLHPNIVVPFYLNVDGDAVMQVLTQAIDLDSAMIGASTIDSFLIANTGCDTLHISSISTGSTEFVPDASMMALAPWSSRYLAVRFFPAVTGTRNATLSISSDGGSTTVALTGKGLPAPQLGIQPMALLDTLVCVFKDTLTLRISNTGQASLTFSLSGMPGWASMPVTYGTVYPSGYLDLDVILSKQGLAIGQYEGFIAINSNDPVRLKDTVTLSLNVPNIILPVNLGPDVGICLSTTHTINAGSGYASYMWSTFSPAQAILVNSTGTYSVMVIDSSGCVFHDTVDITFYPAPIVDAGSDTAVCEAQPVILHAAVSNMINPVAQAATVTRYYTYYTSSPAYSPFATSYTDQRNQYMYRASELTALGLSAGEITSIAINVGVPGAPAMHNFNVMAGQTTSSNMYFAGYLNNMQQVYSDTGFTPVAGWNTITFDNPFYWDGVSNVVVQFCWDNSTTNFSSSIRYHWSGDYTTRYGFSNANTYPGCQIPVSSSYYASSRPCMQFTIEEDQTQYTWRSPTGNVLAINRTAVIPTVTPAQVGYYTVDIDNGLGCTSTDSLYVDVYPLPTANAGMDTSILEVDTASLASTVTGGTSPYSYSWSPSSSLSNPLGASTQAWPPQTTTYTLQVSDYYLCSSSDNVVVTVIPLYDLSGQLTYHNIIQSPLTNTRLYLWDQAGASRLDSMFTNSSGAYSMLNIPAGNYKISADITKSWGGVNSTDALLIQKHVIGLAPLDALNILAADVSAGGTVTSLDALFVMRRTISLDSSFASGNWVEPLYTIPYLGADKVYNFQTSCFGDVNGSFAPSLIKQQPISVIRDGMVDFTGDGMMEIPVYITAAGDIGAITLFMLPGATDMEIVSIDVTNPYALINMTDGVIRLAWADPSGLSAGIRHHILTIRAKVSGDKPVLNPVILLGSEIADVMADLVAQPGIILPRTGYESEIPPGYILGQNSPNPYRSQTTITYGLPEKAEVILRITDVLGRTIQTPVNSVQESGYYTVELSAGDIPAGMYTYTLEATANGKVHRQSRQMVITR